MIIIGVVLIVIIVAGLLYKKLHKTDYEKQKKRNLEYLESKLIEQERDDDDIQNRLYYADENYASNNAGDFDEMLLEFVMSDRFYDNEATHYTNLEEDEDIETRNGQS